MSQYLKAAIEILTFPHGGPSLGMVEGAIHALQEHILIERRRGGEVDAGDREVEARAIEQAEGWVPAADPDFEAYVQEQLRSYEENQVDAYYRTVEGPIEDEDGSIAHMRMLERQAEAGIDYHPWEL